jgi:NADPH:quinone reductase-like Zn-dependent oxidoreductase
LSAFISHQSSSFPISLDDRFHGSDPFPIEANRQALESLCEMKRLQRRGKLEARADEVLQGVAKGTLKLRLEHTYPLVEAAQAHRDLEARRTGVKSSWLRKHTVTIP